MVPPSSTFHGHGHAEPIGLQHLAGNLIATGHAPSFLSEWELELSPASGRRGLSFISAISSLWSHAEESARAARQRGNLTIVGGYHIPALTGDIWAILFDCIVSGEGEEVCVALADEWRRGQGLSAQSPSRGPRRIVARRLDNLDVLPFPVRRAEFLSRYKLHDLMWPPEPQQRNMALVLASRGCAHDCDFCASAAVWGRGVRLRSPANVVRELQDLKDRFGTNTIVIIDQSLGQARQWTLDLCSAIREAQLGMTWYHQSNLTVGRDVLQAMAAAGCTKIGFGVEGISPAAIERVKPQNPHSFEKINELFDYCGSLGMMIKAYLMLGFPWETEQTVKEYLEWLPRLRAHEIKISFLTPFPGTRDWERYSGQLVSTHWADFDTVSMPVVRNPNISVEQYHRIRQDLFHAFYGSPVYADVTRQLLRRRPHYADSYRSFAGYLRGYGMVSGTEAWLRHYEPRTVVAALPIKED